MIIREMTIDDLEAVCSIAKDSFSVPWTENDFVSAINADYITALTSEDEAEGTVTGYAIFSVIADEAELQDIAVSLTYRGAGVGDRLLGEGLSISKEKGAASCFLEVRVTNKPAQNLYRKHGFLDNGLRKGYYNDNNEDALIMVCNL